MTVMQEVPRRTSLAPRVETEGLLDYQGRAGIMSIVRCNLCLVIYGVDLFFLIGDGKEQ